LIYWVIPENIHTSPAKEIGSLPPLEVLIHILLLFIRIKFVSLPPSDSSNFLVGGRVDLFWNNQLLLLYITTVQNNIKSNV
jgi:hypothetical protein